jgi:hypothetical protein
MAERQWRFSFILPRTPLGTFSFYIIDKYRYLSLVCHKQQKNNTESLPSHDKKCHSTKSAETGYNGAVSSNFITVPISLTFYFIDVFLKAFVLAGTESAIGK